MVLSNLPDADDEVLTFFGGGVMKLHISGSLTIFYHFIIFVYTLNPCLYVQKYNVFCDYSIWISRNDFLVFTRSSFYHRSAIIPHENPEDDSFINAQLLARLPSIKEPISQASYFLSRFGWPIILRHHTLWAILLFSRVAALMWTGQAFLSYII
jgi:hypothetical protein